MRLEECVTNMRIEGNHSNKFINQFISSSQFVKEKIKMIVKKVDRSGLSREKPLLRGRHGFVNTALIGRSVSRGQLMTSKDLGVGQGDEGEQEGGAQNVEAVSSCLDIDRVGDYSSRG
jgi:hypothetical protein